MRRPRHTRFQEGLFAYRNADYASALRILSPLAASGDAEVSLALGYMYDYGLGVVQDQRQAAAWYKRGSEHGSPAAKFNLALLYRDGIGVPQDHIKAVALLRSAAEAGDAESQNSSNRAGVMSP